MPFHIIEGCRPVGQGRETDLPPVWKGAVIHQYLIGWPAASGFFTHWWLTFDHHGPALPGVGFLMPWGANSEAEVMPAWDEGMNRPGRNR